MKNPCCYILGTALVVIIGLQIYTINRIQLEVPAQSTLHVTKESAQTSSPTTATTPSPSEQTEQLLIKRENPAACSLSDNAEFALDKDRFITRIRTWYSWGQSEQDTPYTVLRGKEEIAAGTLTRKDCDPYQHQWCVAADYEFNKPLTAGTYFLKVPRSQICQNTASEGKGMIYVWGK